jgi:transmembrane sensor
MTTSIRAMDPARLKRLDDAAEWLLRMQDPARTDSEMNEWLRWIDADPENLAEFERLQHDWSDLDALKCDELRLTPEQKSALLEQERNELAVRRAARSFVSRRLGWALAAGVAAVAISLGVFQYTRTAAPAVSQQIAAAQTSRAATLPDGSRMILGEQSRVDMDFNGAKRQLDLSEGEAYFQVQHDKERPFVVHAGEISVTAVGTAFDVRREHDRITVTVEEGIVEVRSAGDSQPVTWRAGAGYQLTYSTSKRTASFASVSPTAELAWRKGEMAYVREPLGAVVDNLNRYSARRIVIDDPSLAALPFTGTAFVESLDDWLTGIEQAYPVTVTRAPNGDIVLSAAR